MRPTSLSPCRHAAASRAHRGRRNRRVRPFRRQRASPVTPQAAGQRSEGAVPCGQGVSMALLGGGTPFQPQRPHRPPSGTLQTALPIRATVNATADLAAMSSRRGAQCHCAEVVPTCQDRSEISATKPFLRERKNVTTTHHPGPRANHRTHTGAELTELAIELRAYAPP